MMRLTLAVVVLFAGPRASQAQHATTCRVLATNRTRLWRSACIALLCACAGGTLRAGADEVSTIFTSDAVIIINVPIEVLGGDDALIERWKHGIDQSWNRGNDGRPFRVCGRDVVFNAKFAPRPLHKTLMRDAHVVVVENVEPGDSYISRVWHALGTAPTYSARTGFWGSDTDGATAAHEFGHLLGLLDEYVEVESGLRAPGQRPLPDESRFPDAWRSLMAQERGSVLERHVREIIRIHGAGRVLTCAS